MLRLTLDPFRHLLISQPCSNMPWGNIDNHMANWKVIALINGAIEAVSGPAAQDRPGAHEWIVWEGPAADKAEALQSAEKADPRVDLEWMRIRYERDLSKR
jgi:hypothetical protein